ICGGLDAALFPTPDGVLGVGWAGISSQSCSVTSGEGLVGRLARGGTIPADWPVDGIANEGVAAAVNVAYASREMSTVACADGLGGAIVAWGVIDGDAPVLAGEVRAMRFTLQGAVAGVEPSAGAGLALRGARFTRTGIRVRVSGALPGGARLDAHDLLGRR